MTILRQKGKNNEVPPISMNNFGVKSCRKKTEATLVVEENLLTVLENEAAKL